MRQFVPQHVHYIGQPLYFLIRQKPDCEYGLAGFRRSPCRFTGSLNLHQSQPRMVQKRLARRRKFHAADSGLKAVRQPPSPGPESGGSKRVVRYANCFPQNGKTSCFRNRYEIAGMPQFHLQAMPAKYGTRPTKYLSVRNFARKVGSGKAFREGHQRQARTPRVYPEKNKTDDHLHRVTVPTQFVEAKGIRFAYHRFGKAGGIPLVFSQHCAGNLDSWDPAVIDGLAAERESFCSTTQALPALAERY